MEIQTYEIEEAVEGTTPEIEQGAIELIERLDLKGQRNLVKKDGERFQYPEMTLQERNVYGFLFPQRTKVEEYQHGIIPIRVLKVIEQAKGFCSVVEVWHPSVRNPDPLLVGYTGEPYKNQKFYLLARWGDALKHFSELVNEVREGVRRKFKADLEEAIGERQVKLAGVDNLAERFVRGETVHVF